MKLFNAIQIVTLLVAGPIVIPLLKIAPFWGATALMWVLAAAFCLLYMWVIAMVFDQLDKA